MKQFDADAKAAESALEITIGGTMFTAKEPTLAVMKELAEKIPQTPEGEDDKRPEGEKLAESIDSIFPQLEVLLRDEEGRPPLKEFIEEHLSMRRAGEIIQKLMGEEDATNPH